MKTWLVQTQLVKYFPLPREVLLLLLGGAAPPSGTAGGRGSPQPQRQQNLQILKLFTLTLQIGANSPKTTTPKTHRHLFPTPTRSSGPEEGPGEQAGRRESLREERDCPFVPKQHHLPPNFSGILFPASVSSRTQDFPQPLRKLPRGKRFPQSQSLSPGFSETWEASLGNKD